MPGPFTPVSAIPSCPMNLLQILNGVYYYEVGTCSGTVTGWTTSMMQLETGCNEAGECKSPVVTIINTLSQKVDGRKKPLPPGNQYAKKRLAKGKAQRFGRRSKVGVHRKVQKFNGTTGSGDSWFEWAIDNGNNIQEFWEAAGRELGTSTARVVNPNTVNLTYPVSPGEAAAATDVTQSIRVTSAKPQPKLLAIGEPLPAPTGIVAAWRPLIEVGKEIYLELAADAVNVKLDDVGSVAIRLFRIFEIELVADPAVKRLASKLYFGQEISDIIPAMGYVKKDATLIDGHEFVAVLQFMLGGTQIQVHCSTVEPLLADTEYI